MRKLKFKILSLCCFLTGCNSLFYHPDQEIWFRPNTEVLTIIPHKILTPDGESLDAQHILSFPRQRKGLVVQFHGNAQNLSAHQTGLFWLLEEGYDLFVFDYRGYGRSTGKADRRGTIQDGVAVIEYLRHEPELKDLKTIYFGQSLGGAVVFTALSQVKEVQVSALVIESSFSSYRQMAQMKLADFWLTWFFQWPLARLISDELSPDSVQIDPKIPVQFYHNPEDRVVPYRAGLAFFTHVSNINKQFTATPGTGHCGAFVNMESPYRKGLLGFFAAAGSL